MINGNLFTSIYYLSEYALTVQFGEVISDSLFNSISNFNALLQRNPFAGFVTSVPAYTTLSIFYRPLEVMAASNLKGNDCFEKVSHYLTELQKNIESATVLNQSKITIPVCYGNAFGPDLKIVAKLNRLTEQEVIACHTQAQYKVFMIGFVPGFAYLGGMDEKIAAPRKLVPEKAIPQGSVGIAGNQTGIYPLETPGGWQIIGRTPLTLFDASRSQPSLLKAGDEVVFKSISPEEFLAIKNGKQDAD